MNIEHRTSNTEHPMGRSQAPLRFTRRLVAVARRTLDVGCWMLGVGCFLLSSAQANDPFFKKNDVIALVGGEDMVAMSEYGYLELLLQRALPDYHLQIPRPRVGRRHRLRATPRSQLPPTRSAARSSRCDGGHLPVRANGEPGERRNAERLAHWPNPSCPLSLLGGTRK